MRGVLYAAWEIVLLLLIAGTIGVLLGWALTRWTVGLRANRAERDANAQAEMARALRQQNDAMARELGVARAAVHDQEVELQAARTALVAARGERVSPPALVDEAAGEHLSVMPAAEPDESVAAIVARIAADGPPQDDDLQKIRGIGPKLEGLLKDMGITSFAQIARLAPEDIAVVAAALGGFPGRIERDDWVGGAARLYEQSYGDAV
jgi:predicted flap endonuclease-1-like 5' DNA nuclease